MIIRQMKKYFIYTENSLHAVSVDILQKQPPEMLYKKGVLRKGDPGTGVFL